MVDVYLNFNEDVEYSFPSFGDRNQAGVAVVDQQIALHFLAREVVNAASPVGNISHNDSLHFGERELSEDIGDDAGEEH